MIVNNDIDFITLVPFFLVSFALPARRVWAVFIIAEIDVSGRTQLFEKEAG